MIARNVQKIDTKRKKSRDVVSDVENFINSDDASDGRILVLYGLRRTGKTTIMEQVLEKYRDQVNCAFYEVEDADTLQDVKQAVIQDMANGVSLICFDEITKAKDFITNSAALPDIFAKEGAKIIVTGTDSLGFQFADMNELYDRTVRANTTHVSFAEHSRVLETDDIDDYIEYGGLMRKGADPEDRIVHDYTTACRYLDSAVAENISKSIKKNPEYSPLEELSGAELRTIVEKLVELYSGGFDKKILQNELTSASITMANKKSKDIPLDAAILHRIELEKPNIVKDFLQKINADSAINTTITEKMVEELKDYLMDMNVLSETSQTEYSLNTASGRISSKNSYEYYLVQPAIKYYHLQEAKKFIENEKYYSELPDNVKEYLENKLEEKIKGDMTEQIILFDVAKDLAGTQYKVTKPVFAIDRQRKGEYDMLIYDESDEKYWGFEIKHTDNPYYKQMQHLQNADFAKILDGKYGNKEHLCVLYRGNPFTTPSGVTYLNIADFLKEMEKTKNPETVISTLAKNLPIKDLAENREEEFTAPAKGNDDFASLVQRATCKSNALKERNKSKKQAKNQIKEDR